MEVMESVAPLLVWKKELAPDSGGPGRYMGGLGQDMTMEVVSDKPVTLSVISEKWDFPPLGRAGGMAARANRAEKVMGEGPLPRKGRTQLLPGDVINLSYRRGRGLRSASGEGPRPGEGGPAGRPHIRSQGQVGVRLGRRPARGRRALKPPPE